MAIAFLSTLAVQIGSACFNNYRSKKHAQELARKQQAYEEKVVRDGIENARAEFAELCAFQRDLEIETQKDRLNLIRANHENNLIQAAYENSLGSWPLMVPPYVIKNDTILSANLQPDKAIPLNCILTTSSDNKFNKAVFYKLEEALACFCSKYWNVSANKSIRFFQESWRDNFKDVGVKHKDLYAHLSDIPTLVISPVIKNGKLIFRFYWWGLSIDPMDAHLNDIANELDPEVNITILSGQNYSEEEIDSIISKCVPKLEAFMSYFADLYYANFYRNSPSLPLFLNNKTINIDTSDSEAYFNNYIQIAKCSGYSMLECETDSSCRLSIATFKGISPYLDDKKRKEIYKSIFSKYFKIDVSDITTTSDLKLTLKDLDFLREIHSTGFFYIGNIQKYISVIEGLQQDYSVLDSLDIALLSNIEDNKIGIALYRLYQIFEYSLVGKYNPEFAKKCLLESGESNFILAVVENKIRHFKELADNEVISLEILHNSGIQSASILYSKCYFLGLGVEKDEEKALEIINSIKGPYTSEFYYNVATLLIETFGKEEKTTIMNFLSHASELGYVKAMEKLMMIYKGTTVLSEENPEKHFLYAKMAAERGSVVGLVRTGYCYAMGYGVLKSISASRPFLEIAANHGSDDAKKILTVLNSNNE